jgi:hypothetical protein
MRLIPEMFARAVTRRATHEKTWKARIELRQYEGDWTGDEINAGAAEHALVGVERRKGNLLLNGGVSCLWQALMGNGTTTAGQSLTYFNNAQAAIAVGDSTTAAAATQTDMQASTNKVRLPMDTGYPSQSDGTSSGATTITFRGTAGTSVANWAWNEWGVANSTTNGTGRLLNRKVESLGTKPSSQTWQFTVTITIG